MAAKSPTQPRSCDPQLGPDDDYFSQQQTRQQACAIADFGAVATSAGTVLAELHYYYSHLFCCLSAAALVVLWTGAARLQGLHG